MEITSGQRTLALEMVQKLAYASSEAEHDDLYAQLQIDVPIEVEKYFNENWHSIMSEWVQMDGHSNAYFQFQYNRLILSFNVRHWLP